MRCLFIGALVALGLGSSWSGAAHALDRSGWLADLEQMRSLVAQRYANLEWLALDREADLGRWFSEAQGQLERSEADDASSRAAFERLVRRMGDGHVQIRWPSPTISGPVEPSGPCGAGGASNAALPLPARAEGYQAIKGPATFPTGMLRAAGHKVGVLRIEKFQPDFAPSLCRDAAESLGISPDRPCDEACGIALHDRVYARLTAQFREAVVGLRDSGAEVLLVDLTNNPGGSEWAEVAARMITSKRIKSARVAYVRGEAWARKWASDAADLRAGAAMEDAPTKSWLLQLAGQYEAKAREAAMECDGAALLSGGRPPCVRTPPAFYATGALADAPANAFYGKPWGSLVFTPSAYRYEEGIWRGPVIVLVNSESWSAAEEFAALLQDNGAAVIMGAPTGGAGCGHAVDNAEPPTLTNSRAVLVLPDCVRFRRDGANEVSGVQPDVLVGFRRFDGPHRQAALFAQRLPEAVRRAFLLAGPTTDRPRRP